MKKVNKWIASLIVLSIVLALFCCIAGANTKASDYLTQYGAALFASKTKGYYDIFFDVTATDTSDSLGVSQIKIYKADGTYITTIKGTTANGLVREGSFSHSGVYTRAGVSGNSYYAEVTIFAERGGGSDSRTITTNTVKVP